MASLPVCVVLFDGGCPLCRRTVRFLRPLDWFGRLTFADVTDDATRERHAPGLSRDAALAEMYVVQDTGRRTAGFDGYLVLSRALPLLWLPGLVARVPPLTALGRWVYGLVAARRARHTPCSDEVCEPPAPPPRSPRRALTAGLVATAAVAVLAIGLDRIEALRYAQLDVRWSAQVPEPARLAYARRHSMHLLRRDGALTQYALLDLSPGNVEAVRRDQESLTIGPLDPASGRPTEVRHASVLRWLGMRNGVDLGPLVSPASLVPLALLAVFIALLSRAEGRAWVAGRVPEADPLAMALFRAVFAVTLLMAARYHPPAGSRLLVQAGLLLGFGLGVLPRICLALFIATLPWVTAVGAHDANLPVKTLCLLLFVPWGDAPGLLKAWRADPDQALRPAVSRRYGLAFWIPMCTLGLAYFSAAYAKLAVTGLPWITQGAIRYFMAVDGHNAPGELWRIVAASDLLPVVLSFGAIAVEATVVLAALWYSPWAAVLAGLGALGLHGGFWLFQGVWWPFWWAMLPAFLPWTVIAARVRQAARWDGRRAGAVEGAGVLAGSALVLFAGLQLGAVLLQIERPPMLSNFPMYSDLQWTSKEAFAAERDRLRADLPVVRLRPDGGAGSGGAKTCHTDDERVAADVRDRRQPAGAAWEQLVTCAGQALASAGAAGAPQVHVEIAPARFDWAVVGFAPAGPWQQAGTATGPDLRVRW